ncbi:Oligosaccharide repeat unit polymerase Wzy; O-antigen ligase [hydrothermal vent metagenome]|uniref:Oligosaccharide repeat unit polymerase Wzy O-antigen ligase n=1 Tax=hydrothermal vent metagenome TaxID=652676 RepID=A0A1W1CE23_9ZZZZ
MFKSLLLLLFITPLLAPWTLNNSLIVAPDVFKVVFSGVATLILLLVFFIKNDRIIKTSFYLPIILFLSWCAFSLLWAVDIYHGLEVLIPWVISAIMFFIVLQSVKTKQHLTQLLNVLLISGVIVAMIGIFQYLFDFELIRQAIKPASTFGNKNLAGHFMVLVFPISLLFLFISKNKQSIILYALSTFILSVFIIYLNSRSAWLAILLELTLGVIYLIINRNKIQINKNKLIVIGCLFALIIVVVLSSGYVVDRVISVISATNTASIAQWNERINPWLNTLGLIADNNYWFYGTGVGNWSVIYPKYFNYIGLDTTFSEATQLAHAHNDFLEIFASVGVIGVLFLLWLLFLTIAKVFYLLKNNIESHYIIGLFLGLIGFSITSFFSFPSEVFLPIFIVMAYLGLIVNIDFRSQYGDFQTINNKKSQNFYQIKTIFINITIVIFLMISVISARNYLLAQHYYSKALIKHNQNDFRRMLKIAKKSYDYNELNPKTLFLLAKGYSSLGDFKKAILFYKKLLQQTPFNINALFNLSAAYFNSGDTNNGLLNLKKSLFIHPQYIKSNLVLTEFYWFKGDKKKAILQYQKVKKMVLKQKTDYENLGDTAQKIKLYNEAKIAFELAINNAKKKDSAFAKLGIILFYHLNQKQRGLEMMVKALRLNPNVAQNSLLKKTLKPYLRKRF